MSYLYKSKQVIDIHPVSGLIWAAGHKWSALPEWLQKRYEDGDVFFGDKYMTIKSYPDLSGYLGDYLVHSPTLLYFCGLDHINEHFEPLL